jgi:hypothetical protein
MKWGMDASSWQLKGVYKRKEQPVDCSLFKEFWRDKLRGSLENYFA